MHWWAVFPCVACCVLRSHAYMDYFEDEKKDVKQVTAESSLRINAAMTKEACVNCEKRNIVSVDEDFNKLKTDPELQKYVSAILDRLKTFKVPVHPRVRVFHELLKLQMDEYAHRTADSLYVPDKYNVALDAGKKSKTTSKK